MDLGVILAFASAVLAGAIGLAALLQRPRLVSHWALAAGMVTLAAESAFAGFSLDASFPDEMVYWQNWRLFAASWLPVTWLVFSLTFARGNSREFLRKWRPILLLAFIVPVALAGVFKNSLVSSIHRADHVGSWTFSLSTPAYVNGVVLLLASIVILLNLERTFRASVGAMRWRIKYFVIGIGALFAVQAYTSTQMLVFHAISSSLQSVKTVSLLITCVLLLRSFTRSGVFQVNVYPSRSVLHGSVTVFVAGIYLLIVGVLAKIFSAFGGDNAFPLKTFIILISLVLLALLFLSEKVRLQTRRFVSRHFQRPLYDYRTVWRRFTEGTARCLERQELCDAAARLISELFQALSVTIWIVDERKQSLNSASSTALLTPKGNHASLDKSEITQVLSGLGAHPDPVDIDASRDVWAILLRRLHPDEFRRGGNRICVPLIAGGELLGLLTLGDRVGGIPYSVQDFDLLRSVSDQIAASFLNIQLSHRLAQAKQMEAFQTMSTFFVHDLKNTASTLSLMLRNLPVHFNDPEFRADALRGIGKTVTHINDIIARLTSLREGLTLHPAETDLNQLIAEVLSNLPFKSEAESHVQLLRNFASLPALNADAAQLQSVITNLLLNARDAVGANGQIKIETARQNGWAVLAVSDNGCGMTPEFVQNSLFRPFQTSKKKGMGIGMFQSRLIVEAHHGKIEVESEPGKGTSFRVLLPLLPS